MISSSIIPLKAPAHGDHIVDRIAKSFIKGDNRAIRGSNLKVDLRTTGTPEAPLGFSHHDTAELSSSHVRTNREVVDPAAMAFVARHDRGNDSLLHKSHKKPFGINAELACDVARGIVPGHDQFASLPEFDNRVFIRGTKRANNKRGHGMLSLRRMNAHRHLLIGEQQCKGRKSRS